jgi:hypothetical protein
MKGYRFYLEYGNKTQKNKGTVKNPGNHLGTVIAVLLDDNDRPFWHINSLCMDCIGSVFSRPNSCVTSDSVHRDYLSEKCKRIPELLARKIHPELFKYLDD